MFTIDNFYSLFGSHVTSIDNNVTTQLPPDRWLSTYTIDLIGIFVMDEYKSMNIIITKHFLLVVKYEIRCTV